MKHTVHSLRLAGCKVRVTHYRFVTVELFSFGRWFKESIFTSLANARRLVKDLDAQIEGNDGMTEVAVTFPNGRTYFCQTYADGNFSNRLGVEDCLDGIFEYCGYDRYQEPNYDIIFALLF